MFERKTVLDEHVIDQGDDGDNFYVIDNGIYDIFVKIDGNDKKVSPTGTLNNNGVGYPFISKTEEALRSRLSHYIINYIDLF